MITKPLGLALAAALLISAVEPGQDSRPGALPRSVDLRKRLADLGVKPRPQGPRGTCSVFTTVEALEFGMAKTWSIRAPLSVEFANWASNEVSGDRGDGSFFVDCLNGFRKHGICQERAMPYQAAFDAAAGPSKEAAGLAAPIAKRVREGFEVHWILPPGNEDPGLSPRQMTEVKTTLARGYPVAFGSGHSVLLVGFEDKAKKPGGGEFLILDSAANAFRSYTYEFVRANPYDVFWVEFFEDARPKPKRTSWAYDGGTFTKSGDGAWTEAGENGSRFSFRETARNDDFVEILDASRQMTLRIYGHASSGLFYKQPGMRQWARMYDGRWVK